MNRRLYGEKKANQMNWHVFVKQVSMRPRAFKNSILYKILPQELGEYLKNQESKVLSELLSALDYMIRESGEKEALSAMKEIAELGIKDKSSALIHYRRKKENALIVGQIKSAPVIEGLQKVYVDLHLYDAVLQPMRAEVSNV